MRPHLTTVACFVSFLLGTAASEAQIASQTFNLGNLSASGQVGVPLNLTGLSDDYVAFRVTSDWSVAGGDPFSEDGQVSFEDVGSSAVVSDVVAAVNGTDSGDPLPGLTFTGGFVSDPLASSGLELVLDSGTFGDADFGNTIVEWFTLADLPGTTVNVGGGMPSPNAPISFIDLGVLGSTADSFVFDTEGSVNSTGGGSIIFDTPADTEMAVYDTSGLVIVENDDAPDAPEGTWSEVALLNSPSLVFNADGTIETSSLQLAPGDYFLAIDEFNTTFGEDFAVTSGLEADETLDIALQLNGVNVANFQVTDAGPAFLRFSVVPEPTTLTAILACIGAAICFRCRA